MIIPACKHFDLGVMAKKEAREELLYSDAVDSAELVFDYILDELVDIDMDEAPLTTRIDVYKAILKIYGDNRSIKLLCLDKIVDFISLN